MDASAATTPFPPPVRTFIWFKYSFVCSWFLILITFVTFILSAVAVSALDSVASDLCAQLNSTAESSGCAATLECFADCVDQYSVITSASMRS